MARMADLSTINPSIYDFEIYFISDMVENCNETPLGPIKMNDSDSLVLLQLLAKQFPHGPDLSGVRITIIIPSTFDSSDKIRIGADYLKNFWKTIFTRCGMKEEWFWDHIHIDWIASGELPDRLDPKTRN